MQNVKQFRKKPVVIEAIQYDNVNYPEIGEFIGKELEPQLESETAYVAGQGAPVFSITIETLEGNMKAMPKDWNIRIVQGECDYSPTLLLDVPDNYELTYIE